MALLGSRLLRHSVCRNGVRQSPQSAALFTFILSLALHHTADPSRHSHEANVPEVNTFRINWWSCYLLGIVDVIWTMNFPVCPWNVHLWDTCSMMMSSLSCHVTQCNGADEGEYGLHRKWCCDATSGACIFQALAEFIACCITHANLAWYHLLWLNYSFFTNQTTGTGLGICESRFMWIRVQICVFLPAV